MTRNLADEQTAMLVWLLPDVSPTDVERACRTLDIRWKETRWGTLRTLERVAWQLGYPLTRNIHPDAVLGAERGIVRVTLAPRTCELMAVLPDADTGGEPLFGYRPDHWRWGTRAQWEGYFRHHGGNPRWSTLLTPSRTP